MRMYKVRMHHDAGYVNITTNASSEESAIEIACKMEHAPRSAVVSVKLVSS